MDELWTELLVAIITAVISVAITWSKREGYDIKFEDKYMKYKMIFDISGELVRALDEQLYDEMADCVKLMTKAYESTEFTPSMFNQIVKESKDVFDRVNVLLKKRS